MIECLQLRGLSARTQESYVRAVRQLAEHYHKSPFVFAEFPEIDFLDGSQALAVLSDCRHSERQSAERDE
jgi:hypothetical protein